jgi:two-component system response regulator PilR (NtrC family)
VISIKVPPLRERKEDIPALAEYFMKKYSKEFGKEIKNISSYGLRLLAEYPFPGNIRELENIIERSVAMEAGNIILPENLVMLDTFEKDLGVLDDIPDEGIDLNGKMAEI